MKWPESDIFTNDDSGSGVVLNKEYLKLNIISPVIINSMVRRRSSHRIFQIIYFINCHYQFNGDENHWNQYNNTI